MVIYLPFCVLFTQVKGFLFIADFLIGPKVLDHAFELESLISSLSPKRSDFFTTHM